MKKLSNYPRAFCFKGVAPREGATIGGTHDIKLGLEGKTAEKPLTF
jgi:hypothetical protein